MFFIIVPIIFLLAAGLIAAFLGILYILVEIIPGNENLLVNDETNRMTGLGYTISIIGTLGICAIITLLMHARIDRRICAALLREKRKKK